MAGIFHRLVNAGAGAFVYTGCQSTPPPRVAVRSTMRFSPAPPVHSRNCGETDVNRTESASGSWATYRWYHHVGSVVAAFVDITS